MMCSVKVGVDVVYKNVHPLVIGIWFLYLLLDLPFSILGGIIGYWSGKECVQAAVRLGRSPNWAFFFGGFFNLIGWFAYWVYLKLMREDV